MRTLILALALWAAAPAVAQVHVDIQIPLPPVPGLVVIQPGVEVVERYDEEVFYHRGWFWTRRGPVWYRAPSPQARFVYVETRAVPQVLVRLPPGQYRHYRADARAARREWKAERREERREWKEQEKRERRREKEERKARREREKEHHEGRGRD